MKNVIDVLMQRGFIDQMTAPELRDLVEKPIGAYVGFDPTSDSLHLGNLVGIMALAWFQRYGHTPYAILGGATGRIGDPSGKSAERPLLDDAVLEGNVKKIEAFFRQILKVTQGPKPVILNNNDWLGKMSLVDFLRDVGKHFRIGPMLGKEMVRSRLQSEEGISYTEFTYQILQGYDFYHLHKNYGVLLQFGGSDQWGNIVSGIEFNRKLGGQPIYGLTWPLLTRSDGKKFGKSEEGAIWLSSEKLSPYHFYQYLYRVPDADAVRLLKMLTFLDLDEIQEIEERTKTVPNAAQKRLAEEVTLFVHGEEGLLAAERVTEGIAPGSVTKLDAASLKELSADMGCASLSYDEVVGQKFVDVAARVALVSSKSEGARLIRNGGAYLNNERVSDPSFSISREDLIEGTFLLMGAGKKKKMLISVKSI